ncbi:MAG: hypothetical protein AAB383_01155 [Patescibacteria group bacterium]
MDVPDNSLSQVDLNDVPRDVLIKLTENVLQDGSPVCLPGDYLIVRHPDTLSFELKAFRDAVRQMDPNVAYALLGTRGDIFTIFTFADDIHDGKGVSFVGAKPGRVKPGSKENIKLSPITGEKVPVSTQRVSQLPKNRPLFLAADYHRVSSEGGLSLHKLPEGSKPGTTNPLLSMIYVCKGTQVELVEEGGKVRFVTGGNANEERRLILEDSQLEVFVPEEQVKYQRGLGLEA